MTFVYDEIFVGEKNRAMGVLASSLPENESNKLAHHLDLPGQPPQGFLLDTYVSGITIGDYYVISRTSKDLDANRPGMVFSHAFIFDKKAIEQFSDIRGLFRLLQRKRPPKLEPSQKTISSNPIEEPLPPGLVCDMLTKRPLSALVTADNEKYEDLIAIIWPRLLPSMRPSFHFKLSFDPGEAVRESLNVALVPLTTLPRWKLEHRIDEFDEQASATTLAGKSLAASDNSQLRTFVENLEIDRVKLTMYGLLGQACELYTADVAEFNSSLAALRLIGNLQPDPNKGIGIKTHIAESAILSHVPANPENMLALRNLDWAPYSLTKISLSHLRNMFSACFKVLGYKQEKQVVIKSILEADSATNDWRENGKCALLNLTDEEAEGLVSSAWELLLHDHTIGEKLINLVPHKTLDKALASSKEILINSDTYELQKALASNQYYKTEALLLRKHHSGDDVAALAEACQRDRKLFSDIPINEILSTLSAKNKIQAAVDIDDSLVMDAASKCIVDNPLIIFPSSLSDPNIQTMWSNALALSPNAWQIDKDLIKIQDKIWETLNESQLKPALLHALMRTPIGNWSAHNKRSEIWGYLIDGSLSDALNQTAAGWIKSLYDNLSNTNFSVEPTLAKAIAEQQHQLLLLDAFKKCTFDEVIKIFANNKGLSSELFFNTIVSKHDLNQKISAEGAERAGQLASLRNWQSLSRNLFARFGSSGHLRQYFNVCIDHLPLWDRLFSDLKPLSPSDFDTLLLETSTKLYPTGPKEKDIWERSGGDPAQLDISGNGKDQWYRALRIIQLGASISTRALLNQMLNDYPSNSRLQKLKDMK